ncbi:MAG: hypothetical protein AAGB00_09930 [Planctomycetota bacterium]
MGACNNCGYSPLATDARFCPRCMQKDPNPNALRVAFQWLVLGGLALAFIAAPIAGAINEKRFRAAAAERQRARDNPAASERRGIRSLDLSDPAGDDGLAGKPRTIRNWKGEEIGRW